MKTITQELVELYEKMGGTKKFADPTISVLVDAITDVAGSGGGGGGAFAVTVTEDSGTYTADKTFAEIAAAVAAGKIVLLDYDNNFVPMTYCGEASAEFSAVYVNSDVLIYDEYIITVDGVEYITHDYTLTPAE